MIAHIDVDSFFASVLQRKHPHLKGKQLLALGMGGGCVIAASYEAKATGVRTGMPVKEAMKLCPKAVHMPADFAETAIASQHIESILQSMSPVVEQYSIDEWFIDLRMLVGGLPFDLLLWAKELQENILAMTDFSVSIGIAPSKLLAKMASEEHKPAGCTVVERHEIEQFLQRRPAPAIPGIGRKRDVHAKAHQWNTAWDIAHADTAEIQRLFGKSGMDLQQELNGKSLSGVAVDNSPPKSISRTRSFKPTNNKTMLWAYVMQHASYTILKMRSQELSCRGVSLWLRDGEYHYAGEQLRLPQAMDTEEEIVPQLKSLFDRILKSSKRYTQIGCGLWGVEPKSARQFSLFRETTHTITDEEVQKSMDVLRKKYGREVVMRGSMLAVHTPKKQALNLPVWE